MLNLQTVNQSESCEDLTTEELAVHTAITRRFLGWDRLKNGQLLAAAAAHNFDLFLTVDQNIRYQQNLSALPIAIVMIKAASNRYDDIVVHLPTVEEALNRWFRGR